MQYKIFCDKSIHEEPCFKLYLDDEGIKLKITKENKDYKKDRKSLNIFSSEINLNIFAEKEIHYIYYNRDFNCLMGTDKRHGVKELLFRKWVDYTNSYIRFPVQFFIVDDTMIIRTFSAVEIDESLEQYSENTEGNKNMRDIIQENFPQHYDEYLLIENAFYRDFIFWFKNRDANLSAIYLLLDIIVKYLKDGDESMLPKNTLLDILDNSSIQNILRTRDEYISDLEDNLNINFYEEKAGVEYYE